MPDSSRPDEGPKQQQSYQNYKPKGKEGDMCSEHTSNRLSRRTASHGPLRRHVESSGEATTVCYRRFIKYEH